MRPAGRSPVRDPHKGTANMTGRRPSATSPGAGLRPSRHSRLQRPATQAARLGAGPALGLEQTRPRSPSRPGKAPPGGAQTLHLRATRPIEQSRWPRASCGAHWLPLRGGSALGRGSSCSPYWPEDSEGPAQPHQTADVQWGSPAPPVVFRVGAPHRLTPASSSM